MNIFAPLNWLIKFFANNNFSNTIYLLWHIVNVSTLLIFGNYYRKKYSIKKIQAFFTVTITYALGLGFILLVAWVGNGFRYFGENNIIKGFAFFPIFALVPAKLFKIESRRIWDFTAPFFPLLQCVAHIACNFAGCCNGYPWKYGIWNPSLHTYLFPAQLLESIVSLAVFFICIKYAKKREYNCDGTVFPLFLVIFGFARFFLEFTRNNQKIIGPVSKLALYALFIFFVGTVWFVVIWSKKELEEKRKKSAKR